MGTAGPFLRVSTVLALLSGGFSGNAALLALAVVLAVAVTLLEWRQLLPLARLFVGLAVIASCAIGLFVPYEIDRLWRALVQGVSFSALMMVLGMLRQPARRSNLVRRSVEYLLALQLRISLDVGSTRGGLVGSSPERPGDDVGGVDAPSCQTTGDAADFLHRPADQRRFRALAPSPLSTGIAPSAL